MAKLNFADGEKYGLIAVPNTKVAEALPQELHIASDLWVTRSLPIALDSHWQKWLGTILAERIEKASLYLIAKGPSRAPEVLDDENEKYQNRVNLLFWGLLLTDFLWTPQEAPIQLSGAKHTSGLDVRSVSQRDGIEKIPGAPIGCVDQHRLQKAANLTTLLFSLEEEKKHKRFWKIIQGFYDGLISRSAEDRLHQFTRCIEGFILPGTGQTKSQFKSRTELFIGPRHHQLMEEVYDLRSAVEHLHDPLLEITGTKVSDKLATLFRRSYEIKTLARYCLERFVSRHDLWPHFEDDDALRQFWQLPQAERRALWGDPLDIDQVSGRFNESGARIAINDLLLNFNLTHRE
jgi:hypothetical protein